MRKRTPIVAVSIAVVALAGGATRWAAAAPESGTTTISPSPDRSTTERISFPSTMISLADAVAAAQQAETGALGQVDLEKSNGRVVYMVDIGDQEVRVDAGDGSIGSGLQPRD